MSDSRDDFVRDALKQLNDRIGQVDTKIGDLHKDFTNQDKKLVKQESSLEKLNTDVVGMSLELHENNKLLNQYNLLLQQHMRRCDALEESNRLLKNLYERLAFKIEPLEKDKEKGQILADFFANKIKVSLLIIGAISTMLGIAVAVSKLIP